MVTQPARKGFFAKNWLWMVGGIVLLFIILIAVAALVYIFVLRGNAKITDIKLSTDTPVYGQALKAKVTVSNSGVLELNYHAVLMVDGSEAASQDVVLDHNQPKTLEFDISKLQAGDHKLAMDKSEKTFSFKLLKPAAFKVGEITYSPEIFYVGDTVTANAKVTNTGEVQGTFKTAFTYDGVELDTKPVDIGPGVDGTVQAQFKVEAKGTHAVSLDDQKNTFTALNPAKIDVVDIKLSSGFAKPGESVTATITLENTGDVAGTYELKLLIDDSVAQTQSVSVDPGAKKTVDMKVSKDGTGKYTLKAGDITTTLHVVKISRPVNGTFLISSARATSGYVGYVAVFNLYSDKDAMFVLTTADNPSKVVLATFVRAGQKQDRFFVRVGYYYAYFTAGGSFDSVSKRFMSGAVYYKYNKQMDFYTYYYVLGMPNTYWSSVSEDDFPR